MNQNLREKDNNGLGWVLIVAGLIILYQGCQEGARSPTPQEVPEIFGAQTVITTPASRPVKVGDRVYLPDCAEGSVAPNCVCGDAWNQKIPYRTGVVLPTRTLQAETYITRTIAAPDTVVAYWCISAAPESTEWEAMASSIEIQASNSAEWVLVWRRETSRLTVTSNALDRTEPVGQMTIYEQTTTGLIGTGGSLGVPPAPQWVFLKNPVVSYSEWVEIYEVKSNSHFRIVNGLKYRQSPETTWHSQAERFAISMDVSAWIKTRVVLRTNSVAVNWQVLAVLTSR